jgi:hypothetical protein
MAAKQTLPRLFEYFVEAAEESKVAQAADRLHVSQTAFGKQNPTYGYKQTQ